MTTLLLTQHLDRQKADMTAAEVHLSTLKAQQADDATQQATLAELISRASAAFDVFDTTVHEENEQVQVLAGRVKGLHKAATTLTAAAEISQSQQQREMERGEALRGVERSYQKRVKEQQEGIVQEKVRVSVKAAKLKQAQSYAAATSRNFTAAEKKRQQRSVDVGVVAAQGTTEEVEARGEVTAAHANLELSILRKKQLFESLQSHRVIGIIWLKQRGV